MTEATRRAVVERAGGRCEYCRLPVAFDVMPSHIDHILPLKHGGGDDAANLALACFRCNASKGANLTGIDPLGGALVRLFDPRTQAWDEHFEMAHDQIVGLTPTGRVTAYVAGMNAPNRLALRRMLREQGEI